MKTKPTQLAPLPRAQSQTPSRASNPQTQPQTKNSSTPKKKLNKTQVALLPALQAQTLGHN